MKHYRIYLAIAVLVLASLACQAVTGGGGGESTEVPPSNNSVAPPEVEQPTAVSDDSNDNDNSNSSTNTDFPMTDDAFNTIEVGDGSLIYYTKLSAEEAMEFYRDEYTAMGYTERELLTVVASGTFSMVFDGHPSGKAIVIQSVDLGDGSRTIAIRLEDI